MNIAEAQRDMRTQYAGGVYGQSVSALLWLLAAALGTWIGSKPAILALVLGGFLIFPLTEALRRSIGGRRALRPGNTLGQLGAQVAFVLPLSMPLLLPVALYRTNWFFPGMMILLGAHYLPFAFLYGMRLFAMLGAALVGAGVLIALQAQNSFALGAWITAGMLAASGIAGRLQSRRR